MSVTKLDYVKWDERSELNQQKLKLFFQSIERFIEGEFRNSREKALALTKLEETWMWVGKTIKVDQELREIK